jgi:hypothetical protein
LKPSYHYSKRVYSGSIKWIQWSTYLIKNRVIYAVASVTQLVENQTALNAADNFNISLDSMIIASREKFEKINPMVETLEIH